jgi:hypothetical protein
MHDLAETPSVGDNSAAMRFKIVTKMDQLMHVFAVRAICFMEDEGLPVDHAFDDNDLQATHIIAYAGDEPVGALRVRWFSNFAKIERSTFRRSHRDPRNLKKAAAFVFEHIARKGYSRVITHASEQYAKVWRRILGFQVAEKAFTTYHDELYIELVKDLDVPMNAISLESEIAVLFRAEGAWDQPAKYE